MSLLLLIVLILLLVGGLPKERSTQQSCRCPLFAIAGHNFSHF